MSNADWIKLAFFVGIVYAAFRQLAKDVNGIGQGMRAEKAEAHRRWLFEIADRVEEAGTQDQRNRVAGRIRHSAYRI